MAHNGTCAECKHYTALGTENSGLRAADGIGNWHYVIGRCNLQEWDANSSASHGSVHAGRDNLPSWTPCHLCSANRKPQPALLEVP